MRSPIVALALGALGLVACTGEGDQDELDAILKDGDLTMLSRHALTAAAPGDGPVTGTGGSAPGPVPTGMGGAPEPTPTGAAGSGGSAGTVGTDGGMGTGTGGVIGTGMGGFGGGGGRPPGNFPLDGQGLWMFDDCNPFRTDLSDRSFNGHTIFRSVSVGCVEGVINQGVAIDEPDDLIYVPDQPSYVFDSGVTVGAWVKPARLGGIRTIFRKREGGTSTFVLLSNGRDYQFVIRLDNGRAASVSARATVNTFTHVAATYDGRDLRLYLNGALAARSRVVGRLSNGAGPLLAGNDAFGRRMDGSLDNLFFDVNAATPEQIALLTCIPRPSTLVGVPTSSPQVAAGTEFPYDVQLTNNACEPQFFEFQASSQSGSIFVNPGFDFRQVAPGATEHINLVVSSSTEAEPDDYPVDLRASAFGQIFEFLSARVTYSVAGGPCSVRSRRELEIRDLSVVEDPVRTAPGGAWTFGRLMEAMAPTPAAAPAMVEELLGTWLTDQNVNGFTVAARTLMQDLILGPFQRTASGELDLSRAPFRLLAIVNRIDLQDPASGTAGEGRFVFGVLDPSGNPLQLTMIVEYNIPAATPEDVLNLADAWHALAALPFPSEEYNTALQAVTDRFTTRGAAPGRVNDSALGQLRSNDFFALGEWEFREFHLSPTTGTLRPAPVALTPDRSFNLFPQSQVLADFINENEAAIIQQKHTVPETFQGQPFLAGSMITDFFVWQPPGVNPEARQKFALNTCNGCHTSPLETNVSVFQVSPRSLGQEADLSPFLLGTEVFDPFSNLFRRFNELGRRGRILHDLVCPDDPLPPPPPDTRPGDGMGGFGGRDPGTGTAGKGDPTGSGGATGADGGMTVPPPIPGGPPRP